MLNEQTAFADYDRFYRFGIFDKCNGRPAHYTRDESDIAICAYFDGFDNCEVQIDNSDPNEELEIEFVPETKVFKLWLEGDYGQDEYIYGTEAAARRTADELIAAQDDGTPDCFKTFQDMEDVGLGSIQTLTFIPE